MFIQAYKEIKAKQIRQADKLLVNLYSFFTPELAIEARKWKDALEGQEVLETKKEFYWNQQKEIEFLQFEKENLLFSLWDFAGVF